MREPDVAEVSANTPSETEKSLVESPSATLAAERDKLALETADLSDRLLRKVAEFENYRRRTEREKVEMWQAATAATVKEMLPVLDDFERALGVKTADDSLAKGVELIYNRFSETLKRLGLEPMECKGQKFDPNLHEAIGRIETTEAEDGTVVAELQKGYNFKGKLLRPAWVQVAVRS